jgi:exodeoxyribonuclease V alpha subunit
VSAVAGDRLDVRRALRATGLLREFNDAGLLAAADVHVAGRLAELAGEEWEPVRLAAALAVRGPRLGHVFVDLATIHDTASLESDDEEPVDLSSLRWPEAEQWLTAVAASPLVAVGEDDLRADRPLRLLGSRLYLDRYWREERQVAGDLLALAAPAPPPPTPAESLARLFPGDRDERQREAAAAAVRRRFAVVAGGPGTGKTTTVARIVALLAEQAAAAGERPPLVALAAPTGKAAARLQEAVHEETTRLEVGDEVRALLLGLRASTLHRLLGWRPGSHSRFAHDRGRRLPHDVMIVDETSMVSLSLMARLVEAVRPDARLILVGDPGQLASIEAGVVLADIVGPAAVAPAGLAPAREAPAGSEATELAPAGEAPAGVGDGRPGQGGLAEGIVVLERVHRYGGGIAAVAQAVRRGDSDATVAALRAGSEGVRWVEAEDLKPVRRRAVAAAQAVTAAARAGAALDALDALGRFRLLCAHRRGPHGAGDWNARIQGWLAAEVGDLDFEDRDYVGRPLLVTENDYELGLYNGDSGVIVHGDAGHPTAAFERGGRLLSFSPLRLGAVETVYAMTIHKSQGSQFDTAVVLLPPASSRILTRELLYTAVTRARTELILVGGEDSVRSAVARPVARASGLRDRLWGT